MKNSILITTVISLLSFYQFAQSDGCTSATVIGVSADCLSPTAGTSAGASETITGCTGNADDDVWYQFVATSTSHQIVVTPGVGYDPVVQLFSGGCGTLLSLVCKDSGLDGDEEVINYNGLSIGQTYRIRIYDYYAGSGTGNFTICVTTPPPAPSNDLCASPTALNVNASCTYTNATTDGASETYAGCSGNADDDVWFSFVATNSLQNIAVHPLANLDLVFQVYSGSCGNLTSLGCIDNTFTSQDEQSDIVGLVPGQTYLIRVYDYYSGTTGDFQICITGDPTPTPTNDEPCNAIQLPNVTATCQYSQFTTVGATASLGAPTPSSCAGGSGAAIGGFSSLSHDIWFSVTVPASGNLDITPQPNGAVGAITDGVMALYSGTCSSLTQIACSDDHNYPGSSNDLLPLISETGLTPGSTVFVRYFGFGTSSGTFGICASTTTNDDCANALYICDINGYSASTSASYTEDRPDNMFANNETAAGVNLTDGINSGGPFGQAGPWGTGSPFFDVVIDNNSWVKFTASATTATLTVSVYDCWLGAGIQMQIFEANDCMNFVPVSNYEESATGFVITASGLTVGNDYYLMIDGFAGDICNYTISADSGVQFPEIEPVAPICAGGTVTLTAPDGATSYLWAHSGETTQTVNVTPGTSQNYSCEVTGLCDYKQTLDAFVEVIQNPTVAITNGLNISICDGDNVDLIATGASSYTWSTTQTGNTINVAPTSMTSYTVTGTLNGCSSDAAINVSINSDPTLSVNPSSVDSDCGSSNGALNGAVASGNPIFSYSWSDGVSVVGTTANLSNVPAGDYYVTVTDGNTCSDVFGPFNISNPGAPAAPSVVVDNNSPCENGSVQLTATGVGGATYTWSGPNSFSASTATIDITNIAANEGGNYCVSQTVAGCVGPSACESIIIDPLPTINISALNADSTICLNSDFSLTATGAQDYIWTGPNGFTSISDVANVTGATSANDGIYSVTGTDANGCVNSADIPVTILPLPVISLVADDASSTYCNGFIAILSATGADSFNWTGPDNFTSASDSAIVLNLSAASQGYYIAEGTDSEGCINSDSILVTVVTDVPANAPADTTLCPGEKLVLYGSGGLSYIWTGPGGFYSEEQNPLVSNDLTFTETGWYMLTTVDADGCLGYDSTYLDVTNNADCLLIPNLLTPNLDGENDEWEIYGLSNFEKAEVSIYNRWGNLIYYASPYEDNWKGEVNRGTTIDGNGTVPPGTYFYIIELNDNPGEDNDLFKGYIEVEY